jgi:hypothetical protein
VPALIILAFAAAGCSTVMGSSQFSMAQPDASLTDRDTNTVPNAADQAAERGTGQPEWTTRVYQYRGGRDPKTGLAKIQM